MSFLITSIRFRPFGLLSGMSSESRKKFLQNLFIVCHARSDNGGEDHPDRVDVDLLEYSCFIKFINDTKVVICVAQYSDYKCFYWRENNVATFFHYWKVTFTQRLLFLTGLLQLDLTTKGVSHGSVHELGKDIEVPEEPYENCTRLIYAMNTVLECDLAEIYESNMSLFLHDCCCGEKLRHCLWDDCWGKVEGEEESEEESEE